MQRYLGEQNIAQDKDEWEGKISPQDQHHIITVFSLLNTANNNLIPAPKQQAGEDKKAEASPIVKLSFLTGDINTDQIALDYLSDELFDSTEYDPKKYYAQPNLTFFESRLPTLVVMKLVQHAAYGTMNDIEQIKNILDRSFLGNPKNLARLRELLCTPTTIKDPVGRVHKNRTVYQIALGARDYNIPNTSGVQVVDGLVEILGEYFKKLPEGESLRQQQYDGQFPPGFEERKQERILSDSSALNRVIKIVAAATDANCQQTMALDSFHGYDLRPSSWAYSDDEILASAVYLQEEKEGLVCCFRGLNGHVKTKVISWDSLEDIPHSIDDIIREKHIYLPTILEQLAKLEPRQFYSSEQILQLKKLSHSAVTAASTDIFNTAWGNLLEYMQCIVGEAVNFNILKALYQFRHYLEPKGAYTIDYHANLQLPLEAYQLCEENFLLFGNNWFSPKNILCAQKIAGLSQRGLSACELQLHAEGMYRILANNNKSKRSFAFTFGGGSIFPLDSDSFRLGYNCFAGWGAERCPVEGGGGWVPEAAYLEILHKVKTAAQQQLCPNRATNQIRLRRVR